MRKIIAALMLTVGACVPVGGKKCCGAEPVKLVCPAGIPDCKCGCATGGVCTCAKKPIKSPDGNYMLVGWYTTDGRWLRDSWVYCGPVSSKPVYQMPAAGVLGDCPNCRRR